jgi:D-serine deaminase-like pyridoxal phosphate-dependent protein
VDTAALDRLAGERIDWRHKGFPAWADGLTVGELIALRAPVATFATPLMTLDAAALEHNLRTMAAYCAEHGVDLAPHAKTTMSPQLIARQLAAGAWGVTAATIGHVRTYRAFGVPLIVLANELVDPDGLNWVAAELDRDPGFRLICFADSAEGVSLMQQALAGAGTDRTVDVIIDVGWPGGRTGCRSLADGLAVAAAVAASDRLRLVGAGGFEGALAHDRSTEGLTTVRAHLRSIRDLIERIDREAGFPDEIIATAGGSAYFDEVVDVLAGGWSLSRPVRTVLRSGAYITHDDGHYRQLTPLTSGPTGFRAALRIRGRVLSTPEPGLALLDFGKRDAPIDLDLPEPISVERADGRVEPMDGKITGLNDQHAFLAPRTPLSIGDVVACGVSHPCTAFDKWQLIPVVEDGHVVDVVRTFF